MERSATGGKSDCGVHHLKNKCHFFTQLSFNKDITKNRLHGLERKNKVLTLLFLFKILKGHSETVLIGGISIS